MDLSTELEQALKAAAARAPVADAVKAVHAAAGTDWDAAAFHLPFYVFKHLSPFPILRNQLRLPMPPKTTDRAPLTQTTALPPARPGSAQLPQLRPQVHLLASPSARLIATVESGDPSPLTHLAGLATQLPDAVN